MNSKRHQFSIGQQETEPVKVNEYVGKGREGGTRCNDILFTVVAEFSMRVE